MSYKKIYSLGDFGVGQTDGNSADFVLSEKAKIKKIIDNRVIDLRQSQPGEFLRFDEAPAKKKRGRKKKIEPLVKESIKVVLKPMELFRQFQQGQPRISEPLEISIPNREDISNTGSN